MRILRYLSALTACAAIVGGWTPIAAAQSQLPTCPIVQNQVVVVAADQPTEFTLDVDKLGSGTISVFQRPLGGDVQQSGSSPLDFIFIPDNGYTGTTYFTYRVMPESGCRQQALLGRVTLSGPTTGRDFPISESANLCGAGAAATIGFGGILCLGLAHRFRCWHR